MLEILPGEVEERLGKGESLLIVDVRELHEVQSGMIPGAVHIPMGEIPEKMHELDKAREIIFVCRSGQRSGQVCGFLATQGFNAAKNMVGGMLAWPGEMA